MKVNAFLYVPQADPANWLQHIRQNSFYLLLTSPALRHLQVNNGQHHPEPIGDDAD